MRASPCYPSPYIYASRLPSSGKLSPPVSPYGCIDIIAPEQEILSVPYRMGDNVVVWVTPVAYKDHPFEKVPVHHLEACIQFVLSVTLLDHRIDYAVQKDVIETVYMERVVCRHLSMADHF